MRKIIRLIFVAVLFVGAMQNSAASARGSQEASRKPRPIEIFSIPELPASVSAAVLGKRSISSEVSFTVTNLAGETVSRMHLLLLVFDKEGAFLRAENLVHGGKMFPSTSAHDEYNYLDGEVKPEERVLISIYKVIGQTGTWEVDSAKLELAVKAFVSGRPSEPLEVQHDKNLILTGHDKAELYLKTLKDLLLDKEKTKYLTIKDTQNVILSTVNIEPQLIAKISGVNITLMTPEEIVEKTMRDGVFGYLYFYRLAVEGRRAHVSIVYDHFIKVRENSYQPCCGSFNLTFRKEKGQWLYEGATGARF